MIPKEITKLLLLVSDNKIWISVFLFVLVSYIIVGLLTWSFIKPLKYLGIPTICVGSLFLFIRLFAGIASEILGERISAIGIILPAVLKPVLLNGIICLTLGIAMIITYVIITKTMKKKNSDIPQNNQVSSNSNEQAY